MITWIDFKTAKGPLALLIDECLRNHKDVFGEIKPIDVWLSDDGTLGELHLTPDCFGKWVSVTIVPVNLSMFQESPVSDSLRKNVVRFFDDFAWKHRTT